MLVQLICFRGKLTNEWICHSLHFNEYSAAAVLRVLKYWDHETYV